VLECYFRFVIVTLPMQTSHALNPTPTLRYGFVQVGAGTELKAVSTLLKRQSDIVGACVTHRSLADIKAAMLAIIQSQMDWQKSLDDMFETCGVDTRMTVRGALRRIS